MELEKKYISLPRRDIEGFCAKLRDQFLFTVSSDPPMDFKCKTEERAVLFDWLTEKSISQCRIKSFIDLSRLQHRYPVPCLLLGEQCHLQSPWKNNRVEIKIRNNFPTLITIYPSVHANCYPVIINYAIVPSLRVSLKLLLTKANPFLISLVKIASCTLYRKYLIL